MDKKNWWVALALAASMLVTTSACAADAASAPSDAVPPSQANCRPDYPPAAVRAQAQGVVKMRFHVDIDGKVTQVDIIGSSGKTREHKLLDHAAAFALARCPLKPLKDENGNPTAGEFDVSYTWRLE